MNAQIVTALVNILVMIDTASESDMDTDFAVVLQGEAAIAFDSLSHDERLAVAAIVAKMAAAEPPGERKDALIEFSEAYGLDDNPDDVA